MLLRYNNVTKMTLLWQHSVILTCIRSVHMSRSSLVKLVCVLLLMFGVVGCGGGNSANSAKSTPTDDPSLSLTPTAAPFQITSVATSVSPKSFYGVNCGSPVNFTFPPPITAPQGSNGGTVNYTWNVGSSHIPGSVTFASGD